MLFFAGEIHFLEQKCVWALEPSLRAFLRHCLYTSRRTIDSLIFLLDLFEFILHIVVTYWLFTLNLHPSLTENTHNILEIIEGAKGFRFTKLNATDLNSLVHLSTILSTWL